MQPEAVARRFWRLWNDVTNPDAAGPDAADTGAGLIRALPGWKRVEFEDALGRVLNEIDDEYMLDGVFVAIRALSCAVVAAHQTQLTRKLASIGMRAFPDMGGPIHLFWQEVEEALATKTFFYAEGCRDALFAGLRIVSSPSTPIEEPFQDNERD